MGSYMMVCIKMGCRRNGIITEMVSHGWEKYMIGEEAEAVIIDNFLK